MERKDHPETLKEFWFPGGHGCVGGGSVEERFLSEAALLWMIEHIKDSKRGFGLGLEFDLGVVEDRTTPKSDANFNTSVSWFYQLLGMIDRSIPTKKEKEKEGKEKEEIISRYFDNLHQSVKERWRDRDDYRPTTLDPFSQKLDEWKQQNPKKEKAAPPFNC